MNLTPPQDAWHIALIAGSQNGAEFWTRGCQAAKGPWAQIQMRCNDRFINGLAHNLQGMEPITRGMGTDSTLLAVAVEANNMEALNMLIKNSATVNEKDNCGYTVLNAATEKGNTEMVERLIEAGADVGGAANEKDNEGTPLTYAATCGHWSTVVALLNAGANPNVRTRQGWAPIDYAASDDTNGSASSARCRTSYRVKVTARQRCTSLRHCAAHTAYRKAT